MKLTATQRALSTPGECTTCGTYAPVGRNTAGQCTLCHNRSYDAWQARRKAEIAAMARCELCGRRGTLRFPGAEGVLLCGVHGQRLRNRVSGAGMFAMFATLTREAALNIAR